MSSFSFRTPPRSRSPRRSRPARGVPTPALENSLLREHVSEAAPPASETSLLDAVASADGYTAAPSLEAIHAGALLREGHEGPAVAELQRLLGVQATGRFGPTTTQAVIAYQNANGLRPPPGLAGVVGATTLDHIQDGVSGLNSRGSVGPYAAWATGGGSSLLPQSGDWGEGQLREHHTDRTVSAAADRVRAGRDIPYGSVEAYDFTFEKLDSAGNAVPFSGLGLPLMAPTRCRVLDIQKTFRGSGGYGKFILLEYLDGKLAGERVEIHHLHTVEDLNKGQVLEGGTVFGTQGGSGSTGPNDFPVHIDIVGTPAAVVHFTKSNQTGTFHSESRAPENAPDSGVPGGAVSFDTSEAPTMASVEDGAAMLREGHTGSSVWLAQSLLGVDATGTFDEATKAAVIDFQTENGLQPPAGMEGFLGELTLERLLGSAGDGALLAAERSSTSETG